MTTLPINKVKEKVLFWAIYSNTIDSEGHSDFIHKRFSATYPKGERFKTELLTWIDELEKMNDLTSVSLISCGTTED